MARVPITVLGFRCERCSHEWLPRGQSALEPRVCPKCKSPYWNRPRNSPPMTYERFRDVISKTLRKHGSMTWTELRTTARLPQLFPNNGWVRRLERDINLNRTRDTHGIVTWSKD